MTRTRLAVAAGFATGALLLAGCSGADGGGGESGPVELTFWHGYTEADGDVLGAIIDDFNAQHDDIEIVTEVRTWDSIDDSLLPALSAGDGPQIVAMPAERLPVYADSGAFVSLDSYYAASENATLLNEGSVDMVTIAGERYGVPVGFVPLAMFYNQGMFDEAGITAPPATWEEWIAVAQQLEVDENGDGTPERYGVVLPDHATVANGLWPALFYGNGGDVVADGEVVIDSPENAETLKLWQTAIVENQISPSGVNGIDADGLFSGGQAAMTIGGPWMASIADENSIEYGIAPIPAGPVQQASSAIGISVAVTENSSDAQRAAAETFFEFFYEEDVVVEWSLGSGWPPLRSDIDPNAVAENPVVAELTTQAEFARPLLPGVVNSVDVIEAIDQLTQRAMAGEDVDSLLAEAQQRIADAVAD